MCVIIYNELWELLCDKLGQPSWLRYLPVLYSANPSDTEGQRDCSIESISIKAFFPPSVQTYAFFISFSKTTRYGVWTAFLRSWLRADQAKSWGVVGGALRSFFSERLFLLHADQAKSWGVVGGPLGSFSSERLFLRGASSVKGYLKSFHWEEAIGANPASDEGAWERRRRV